MTHALRALLAMRLFDILPPTRARRRHLLELCLRYPQPFAPRAA